MIIHTVTFKTRHPIGSEEEKDFLRAGKSLGKLPMVHNFQLFKQVSEKNEFNFGFSMEFQSQIEYDAYNAHVKHREFVEKRWKLEVETYLEIDYEKYEI